MLSRAVLVCSLLVSVWLHGVGSSVVAQDGGSVAAQDGPSVSATEALSARVDHPLVPLATIPIKIFVGEALDETDQRIAVRVEETVLPRAEQVAGIDVTVVDVDDYHNGEFVETTADFFAQGADGTVYYMGKRVDKFADGKIIGHDGAWLAGEQGHQPGLFMPGDPVVGDTFVHEHLPGPAVEQATVIAVDQTITTPAGAFRGCVVTKGVGLPEGITEEKTYCPEVGLVYEDFPGGYLELVKFETIA
jgi:hypothetical protein